MKYERLTNSKEWTDKIDLTQEYGYMYIWKRLNELENKIENGELKFFPPNKEKLLPCKCGCNRREHIFAWGGGMSYKCMKCGYESRLANTERESRKKWNEEMRELKEQK